MKKLRAGRRKFVRKEVKADEGQRLLREGRKVFKQIDAFGTSFGRVVGNRSTGDRHKDRMIDEFWQHFSEVKESWNKVLGRIQSLYYD